MASLSERSSQDMVVAKQAEISVAVDSNTYLTYCCETFLHQVGLVTEEQGFLISTLLLER